MLSDVGGDFCGEKINLMLSYLHKLKVMSIFLCLKKEEKNDWLACQMLVSCLYSECAVTRATKACEREVEKEFGICDTLKWK